jgi:hypothetical protein
MEWPGLATRWWCDEVTSTLFCKNKFLIEIGDFLILKLVIVGEELMSKKEK